jgi:hypothetical protein
MRYAWRAEYLMLVHRFVRKRYGGLGGITAWFPYMEAHFKWTGPDIADVRPAVKTIWEYHALERYARQYHVTAQYEVAAEHWLIAAAWRQGLMNANDVWDEGHVRAVEFAVKNYKYNLALFRWQKRRRLSLPKPEQFGLSSAVMDTKEAAAQAELDAVYEKSVKAKH